MKGIPTIDCMVGLDVGAARRLAERWVAMGLLRDEESTRYYQPAEHFFKDSRERIERGATVEELVALMDEVGVERGLVGVPVDGPEPMLDAMAQFPQRFFGAVNVNPFYGMDHVRKLEHLIRNNPNLKAASVTGFEVQKPYNDKVFYPLYAKCVELDIPVIVYVGIPGPRIPGECQNPVYLDEVLWFFPDLKIVMRHGGEPWEAMCVKLMLKWPNLYYSTSAFAPRYIPKDIIQYANTRGSEKVLYAGYYPGIDYRRLKTEIEELPLRDQVWPRFLRENAIKVFKLAVNDQDQPRAHR